jgi:hypothetical protein
MDSQTIANLTTLLTNSVSPAVLLSFGKDSLLLTALAREIRPDVQAVWFRDGTVSERVASNIILEWGLTVYCWQPANLYTVADGPNTALISEYSVNGELIPLVTDVVAGDGICLRNISRTPGLYLPFDLLLSGYKDADQHWLRGPQPMFPEGLIAGNCKLVAPLRHLTDSEVIDELTARGLAHVNAADEVVICSDCAAGKPLHWDRPLDLTAFKRRMM